MAANEIVVGMDLGTTNSEVAVVVNGRPVLIPVEDDPIMPSVVGLAEDGSLLVGRAASNQYVLYPERTVRSVKRVMGEEIRLTMGDSEHTPVEIAAMILRRLKVVAENYLKTAINRAVITVPAYFSDAQRTATKEAGEIAGLKVERILNEPTAASLCYLSEDQQGAPKTFLVYDLGGGTFDVSIVKTAGNITEVLASHGDSHLGGDDFDRLLLTHLTDHFKEVHEVDPLETLVGKARLLRASEEAKIRLSTESYVQVTEENIARKDGVPLHLVVEVSRDVYQEMIMPLIHRTKDSIQTALREADVLARDLDEVILVGGSTRTPLISDILFEITSLMPRSDVDPDLAVAMGAALQGARIAGVKAGQILVDITPFSFGTSYFGSLDGAPSPHCYKAIVRRNTPLPTRQTELFYTMWEGQEEVEVNVYQGEETDARRNIKIGRFMVDGLDESAPSGSPILFDMRLNLNGILEVEVTEKHTGLKKRVTIDDAFRKLSDAEIEEARARLDTYVSDYDFQVVPGVYEAHEEQPIEAGAAFETVDAPEGLSEGQRILWSKSSALLEKAQRMLPDLDELDRKEVQEAAEGLKDAIEERAFPRVQELSDELADILFYLE